MANSMKLWAMLCRATQDRWVMVESSDQMWSSGEGNGKPLQYSCLENPMNSMKRQKDMTMKDELPRSVGAHHATGEEWINSSRKNEEMEPKQKQCPIVNVTGDGSQVRCCKEQYFTGTWNVRSMNQDKLDEVTQEMARVNINILRITELKWTGISEFNSDDCCSLAFWETNSLRRTMQIVEWSLLHRRAQGRVLAKDPNQHLWKSFTPHVRVPPQIPWDLHKLRKGKYNPNNPITHVPCAQTVKQLANNQ